MDKKDDLHYYGDIIDLPHHQSKTRPHMSMQDRAAQFSPFAALQGHDAAIKETARLTDEKMELDENAMAIIDERLQAIAESLDRGEAEPVTITYFQPDAFKSGGRYVNNTGCVKKIDSYSHEVIMEDKTAIRIEMICGIDEA